MKLIALFILLTLVFPIMLSAAAEEKPLPPDAAEKLVELNKALDYVRDVLRTGRFTSDELYRSHAACERITGIKGKGVIFTQGVYLPDFKALKKDFREWVRVRNVLERRLFAERAGDKESKDEKPRQ
ncbi:MAG: hypothetical protein AAB490_03495 [Patescibacteria group bacterium]